MIETEASTNRPRQRWRPWGAVAAVVVLLLGVGAWWFSSSARLVSPGGDTGSFGISVPTPDGPAAWSFGSIPLCLEGVDSVVIESVEAGSEELSVTHFAVRPTLEPGSDGVTHLLGAEPRPLAFTDFGSGRTLRGQCADEEYTELAVELSRSGDGTARADGLLVRWSAGLRSGALLVRGSFVLCENASTDAGDCQV